MPDGVVSQPSECTGPGAQEWTAAREVPAEAMGIDGIPGEHCVQNKSVRSRTEVNQRARQRKKLAEEAETEVIKKGNQKRRSLWKPPAGCHQEARGTRCLWIS